MKRSNGWVVLIYGILILILGVLGYERSDSLMSLYVGGGLGLLLILSAILMFFKFAFGNYTALFLTLVLTGTFAIRYSLTHKGIPAILAVLSGAMLLFLLARAVPWRK